MKKLIFLVPLIAFILTSCSKKTDNLSLKNQTDDFSQSEITIQENEKVKNFELLIPYMGTYLPEVYISALKQFKSHLKASDIFRENDSDNPNALFLNEESLDCIMNFHEGYGMKIVDFDDTSLTVGRSKEIYRLEEKQFLIIGNTKYRKIADIKNINEKTISDYITSQILPSAELSDKENTFKVSNNEIYYNDIKYQYGTSLVFSSPVYDYIISINQNNNYSPDIKKYIEILDHKINIYTASATENNYDDGWEQNAVYELESSFKY